MANISYISQRNNVSNQTQRDGKIIRILRSVVPCVVEALCKCGAYIAKRWWINGTLKGLFYILIPLRFVSFIVFSHHDTTCIVNEQASILDCGQESLLPNPKSWIFAWIFMSNISSMIFLLIILANNETLHFNRRKARTEAMKKGSLVSFLLQGAAASIYYLVRIFTTSSGLDTAISVFLLLWPTVMILVVFCLNYVPRVRWESSPGNILGNISESGPGNRPEHGPGSNPEHGPGNGFRNGPGNGPGNGPENGPQNGPGNSPEHGPRNGHENGPGNSSENGPGNGPGNGPENGPENGPGNGPGNSPENGPGNGPENGPGDNPGWLPVWLSQNTFWFLYWLALLMYLLEIICKLIAVALDVAFELAPLIQNKFPDESQKFKGFIVLGLGLRLAFHASVLSFFWEKIFHGDNDLFTTPCGKLEIRQDEQVERNQLQNQINVYYNLHA